MRSRGIGCLPVVERGRVVGIVTIAHLLAVLENTLKP
jgi:CBS domain-containing protein